MNLVNSAKYLFPVLGNHEDEWLGFRPTLPDFLPVIGPSKNHKNLWWKVHKEDHEICERLQLGRSSPISKNGGLLSPHWENSVRSFLKIVIKALKKSGNRKKGKCKRYKE